MEGTLRGYNFGKRIKAKEYKLYGFLELQPLAKQLPTELSNKRLNHETTSL